MASGEVTSGASATTKVVMMVLDIARDLGYTVTRTTLAKLLYFADLAAVKAGTEPVSGLQWRWLHHGPYNNTLLRIESELASQDAISVHPYFAGWQLAIAPEVGQNLREVGQDFEDELDDEQVLIVRKTVTEMGRLAAVSIRDLSYQTEPMIEAQARGRGTVLNLDLVRPVPKVSGAVARARQLLREKGRPEAESGAADEVVAEMAELAHARRKATSTILGDD